MRLFCGKQGGSICVFLTLILVPVLLFSGIIVDASAFCVKDSCFRSRWSGYRQLLHSMIKCWRILMDWPLWQGSRFAPEQEALKKMFCESISARYLKHADSDDLSSVIQVSLAEWLWGKRGIVLFPCRRECSAPADRGIYEISRSCLYCWYYRKIKNCLLKM